MKIFDDFTIEAEVGCLYKEDRISCMWKWRFFTSAAWFTEVYFSSTHIRLAALLQQKLIVCPRSYFRLESPCRTSCYTTRECRPGLSTATLGTRWCPSYGGKCRTSCYMLYHTAWPLYGHFGNPLVSQLWPEAKACHNNSSPLPDRSLPLLQLCLSLTD
jgi:hypothetical protein